MKKWLRNIVIILLVVVAGNYAWKTFAGRDRQFYGKRAEAAMRAGEWRNAASDLQSLLAIDPENDEARWFLSTVYRRIIQKEGQRLEDVPETPESLALLNQLQQKQQTYRVALRLMRHSVRVGDRRRAIEMLPYILSHPNGARDATPLASRLLVTTTGSEESDQILAIMDPAFGHHSLLYIRLKMSVYIRDGREKELNKYVGNALGHLAAAHHETLKPLTAQNKRLLDEVLQAPLQFATNTVEADRRFVQTLQVLKLYMQKDDLSNQDRVDVAEIGINLASVMESRFPLPPIGRGGLRTRQRQLDARKIRREASKRILELGLPLVQENIASARVYEYVARASANVQDDSRQVAIFREGLRLYGDLPSNLKGEILETHRDNALDLIAKGQLGQLNAQRLFQMEGAKSLGYLIAGYVAVEHGDLVKAQQHVARAKEDKTISVPTDLLQMRIHLAGADWESALNVLRPLEPNWNELSSSERVWIEKSLGGRDALKLLIAYCHLKLDRHSDLAPVVAQLDSGSYRARARLLRILSFVRQGRWQDARTLTAAAFQQDPNNLALLMCEFAMRLRQGNTDQAEPLLFQYSSLYPSDLRLRIALARWLAIRGQTTQALSVLRQTAEQFPDDQVGPLLSADLLQPRGREAELDTVLRHLSRPSTASAIVLISAINQLRDFGLDEAADSLFESAPGLPSAQEFAISTAVLAFSRGHYSQGLEQLTATIGVPQPLRRGKTGYLKALAEALKKSLRRTLPQQFDRLIEEFPNEPALLLASARLQSRLGNTDKAISRLEEVRELHPIPGQVDFLSAEFLHKAGRIDEARKSLNATLESVPNFVAARLLAGELAWKQRDYQVALDHLKVIGPAGRTTPDLLFIHADSLNRLGHSREAEPFFVELLNQDPTREGAWLALAEIRHNFGRLQDTIETYEAGLEHVPEQYEMQEKYLDLLGQTQQLDKLKVALSRFSGLRPDFKRCLHLAEIYIEANELKAADQWLLKAREVDPYSNDERLLFMESILLHQNARMTDEYSFLLRARKKYTALLDKHPGHVRGFTNLAWLLMRRFEASKEAGQRAALLLRKTPAESLSAEQLDTVVEALRQSGRTKSAHKVVTEALERFPNSGALRFQFAALLFEMAGGDESHELVAEKQLEKARKLGLPGHHHAELAELMPQPGAD